MRAFMPLTQLAFAHHISMALIRRPLLPHCRSLATRNAEKAFEKRRLYIRNLPSTSKDELQEMFAKFGKITDVFIPKPKEGRTSTIGFIAFQEEQSAQDAIVSMNGFNFEGKKLLVKLANARANQNERQPKFRSIIMALNRSEPTAEAVAKVLRQEQDVEQMTPQLYTSVISGLARRKDPLRAILVLESIPEYLRNTIHYTSAISACAKGGRWKEALQLFDEMGEAGVQRNMITYNSAISACAKAARWQHALRLFNEMEELGIERNMFTYSSTINACANGGQWEEAMRLFNEMGELGVERNTITYSSAISACEKGGQWEEALRLFEEMAKMGVWRNDITYGATISACSKGGQWEEALRLFGEMGEMGVERNTTTYSSAITACAKGGQWEEALRLFNEMGDLEVERNTTTYSSTISACANGGQWKEALRLFNEMGKVGVERNTITYNAMISACGKAARNSGQWEEALRLLSEMEEMEIERNTITYNSTISACASGGQWKEALRLFDDMAELGVERDTITYASLLNAVEAQADVARPLFLEALQQGLLERPRRSPKTWLLDLHRHSEGSAAIAVRWWLEEEVEPWLRGINSDGEDDDASSGVATGFVEVELITGHGTRTDWQDSGNIKQRVTRLLDEMGVPLNQSNQNPGRLAVDCAQWLGQIQAPQ